MCQRRVEPPALGSATPWYDENGGQALLHESNYVTKSVMLISLSLILCAATIAGAQPLSVILSHRSTPDRPSGHVVMFCDAPVSKLILPSIGASRAKFFHLFGGFSVLHDERRVNVMVLPGVDADTLFVDRSCDGDLTNDGPPLQFSTRHNELSFDVISNADHNQSTTFLLQRKPSFTDSMMMSPVDSAGNLAPGQAMFWSTTRFGNPEFDGKRGTFYFDDRLCLRRGDVTISGKRYALGILDWDFNGLYTDTVKQGEGEDDCLIVDLNGDGVLDYDDAREVFKLSDVIPIGARRFRLMNVDRYGRGFDLVPTLDPPTFYYLNSRAATQETETAGIQLDTTFWSLTFTTLDDKKIETSDLKGKYILLNFWGEWCRPCRDEIDELVRAYNKYPADSLIILSFLETADLAAARRMIVDRRMGWDHVLLGEKFQNDLKVNSFPTNILILPDGEIRSAGQVNRHFFEQYLR